MHGGAHHRGMQTAAAALQVSSNKPTTCLSGEPSRAACCVLTCSSSTSRRGLSRTFMFCHEDAAGLTAMWSSTVGLASRSVEDATSCKRLLLHRLLATSPSSCAVCCCSGIIQWSCWYEFQSATSFAWHNHGMLLEGGLDKSTCVCCRNAIFALFLVYAHDANPWVRCTRALFAMSLPCLLRVAVQPVTSAALVMCSQT